MVSRRHLLKLSALGTASFAAPLAYSASNTTMTHNTGNPIGSTSPKDLSDNARNLDYLVSGDETAYPDRKGVPRKSWKGIEGEHNADQARRQSEFNTAQGDRGVQFDALMEATGYEPPIPYVPGILLDRTTKTVSYLGNEYRAKGSFIPLTTSNWAADEVKLRLIGDDSLRQDIFAYLPSVSDYPGATDQAVFSAAIGGLNSRGGGTLNIPMKHWSFTGPIVATISTSIVLNFLGGSVLDQAFDSDMFIITLAEGGSINFAGSAEIKCSFAGRSASSAIIKVTGSGKLRDFVISGVLRYRAGGPNSQFKYGINAIGVQDPDAQGLLIYGVEDRADLHMTAFYLTNGAGQASTNWKIWGPASYGTKYGLHIESDSYPGVEGIKIMAGDFVNCEKGIVGDASASGYAPPQLELVSCHVNSYSECVIVKGMINVKLLGGLLYRKGSGTTAPFVDLTDCQDVAVLGVTMHCITAGLDIPGMIIRGSTRPLAFVRIDANHFWLNVLAQPCIRLIGDVSRAAIGGANTKATAAPWLDSSGVTSGKAGIVLSSELVATANDSVRTSVTPVAGVLDLRESLTTNIILAGVISTTVITSILGRKGWTYDIRSDVAGVAYTPSAAIQIGGATANYAYYIAGSFFSFFMDGDTAARYVSGSAPKSLRSPILPVQMSRHASGSLPAASANGDCHIMVTGIAGYTIPCYSDGSAWRKYSDNTVVT